MVTEFLRDNGFDNAWNLAGGIDAWSRLVESGMPRY
jgi:rhodanese-related sulfurtransferase